MRFITKILNFKPHLTKIKESLPKNAKDEQQFTDDNDQKDC